MPWETPTLREVRSLVRDAIRATLPGADATVPNSVLRVLSDVQGATCHLNLQYLDWLALQLMVDTSETEWLDRHGYIWLQNSDGTMGRKGPTAARGAVTFTGVAGTIVPDATLLTTAVAGGVGYETTEEIVIGTEPSPARVRALDPGTIGNQIAGATLSVASTVPGADLATTVVVMTGGTDLETDDQLRMRILQRIRHPPAGGSAEDYVRWALAVPGVTRAWCSPLSMGMGTISIRVMMDNLRATDDPLTNGFPLPQDLLRVETYIDSVRPVAIKDRFVLAPIPEPIDFSIEDLVPDNESIRAAIAQSVEDMIYAKAAPGHAVEGVTQPATTMYAAWVSDAILNTPNVYSFHLIMEDHVMPHDGALAVMGTITYL